MNHRSPQFGPWTTTLHYNNRLELSAFWQRRLRRLESLRTGRTRMSLASAIGVGIVAGALVVFPRLEMEPTALAEESSEQTENAISNSAAASPGSAAPANQQAPEDQPFTATFSNGVKVQLIGLSENPSQDKPWWAPD